MQVVKNVDNHSNLALEVWSILRAQITEAVTREEVPNRAYTACFEQESYLLLEKATELLGKPCAEDSTVMAWRVGPCCVVGYLRDPTVVDRKGDDEEEDEKAVYLTPFVGEDQPRIHGISLVGPMSAAKELHAKLKESSLEMPEEKEDDAETGIAHMLLSSRGVPRFRPVGKLGADLVRDNYSLDVLNGYDSIVQSIKAESPSGRLSILNGPPGTGKTRMVRGMLSAIENAVHVLIPAKEVAKLADPEMLTSLLELQENSGGAGTRIVLYLEDADQALVPRSAKSLPVISTLLQATDGMIGALLNLYVVATTNQTLATIDDALKRPGRLDVQLTIDKVSGAQATAIYKRLAPNNLRVYKSAQTLAVIYADAAKANKS